MKKFNLLLAVILGFSVVFLNSCSKEKVREGSEISQKKAKKLIVGLWDVVASEQSTIKDKKVEEEWTIEFVKDNSYKNIQLGHHEALGKWEISDTLSIKGSPLITIKLENQMEEIYEIESASKVKINLVGRKGFFIGQRLYLEKADKK